MKKYKVTFFNFSKGKKLDMLFEAKDDKELKQKMADEVPVSISAQTDFIATHEMT